MGNVTYDTANLPNDWHIVPPYSEELWKMQEYFPKDEPFSSGAFSVGDKWDKSTFIKNVIVLVFLLSLVVVMNLVTTYQNTFIFEPSVLRMLELKLYGWNKRSVLREQAFHVENKNETRRRRQGDYTVHCVYILFKNSSAGKEERERLLETENQTEANYVAEAARLWLAGETMDDIRHTYGWRVVRPGADE